MDHLQLLKIESLVLVLLLQEDGNCVGQTKKGMGVFASLGIVCPKYPPHPPPLKIGGVCRVVWNVIYVVFWNTCG